MKTKFILIGLLVLLSVFLIFFQFNEVPKNLTFDEIEFAKLALSLKNKPYTPYSPLATGHSTLYFYVLLFSFKIFGINNFALRFPAAFFGVLNIVIFFLIVKKIFFFSNYQFLITNYFSFFLSLIFLSSRWYFNFARFAFEATFLLFLELLSILFFFLFLNDKKKYFLPLSFLFAGLSFNSYTPGRIFFLLPLMGFFLSQYQNKKKEEKRFGRLIALSLFLFLVIISPLSIYLIRNSDIRFQQQFFLGNSDLNFFDKLKFLVENIFKTILLFFWQGDVNGRHNYPLKPALNPLLFSFFVFGLILSLKKWKNFYNQFFLFYFFLSIIPTLMTYPWENPNMLRTFTVLPSVIFFIGRGVEFLFKLKIRKRIKKFLILIILFLFFLSSFYEIRTYFKYQAKVFQKAFEIKDNLEQIVLIKRD